MAEEVSRSINVELRFSELSGQERDILMGFVSSRLAEKSDVLKKKGIHLSPSEIEKVRIRWIKCSSTGCRCRKDPGYFHGPYMYVVVRGLHDRVDISLGIPPESVMDIVRRYHGSVSNRAMARKCRLVGGRDSDRHVEPHTLCCPTF